MIGGLFLLTARGDGALWTTALAVFAIGLLVTLVSFGIRYAKWATTDFVVTTERVISRSGVLSKEGIEIPLDRINTVFFSQKPFERIAGSGDLGIESAGEGGRQTFTNIRKPSRVQSEIYAQKEAYEQSRLDRMGAASAGLRPPPSDSIPDQIAKLDDLRRQGAITQAEFDEKKAELLRRM